MSAAERRTAVAAPAAGARPMDRETALLLHAMPEADRAWLLERLPAAQREALRVLVAELRELGIPADRTLLERALAAAAPGGASTRAEAVSGAQDGLALREATPGALAALLCDEPAALTAHALRLVDPARRRGVLERLEAGRRARVEAALAAGAEAPPPLAAAIAHALAQRLGGASGGEAQEAVHWSWSAWFRRLRRRP